MYNSCLCDPVIQWGSRSQTERSTTTQQPAPISAALPYVNCNLGAESGGHSGRPISQTLLDHFFQPTSQATEVVPYSDAQQGHTAEGRSQSEVEDICVNRLKQRWWYKENLACTTTTMTSYNRAIKKLHI